MADKVTVTPEVGMGITFGAGSDCYPGTISRVSESGKTFWYKRDDFRRTDSNDYGGEQEYEITPDPNAGENRVSLTKRGWREVGGGSVGVGFRRAYQDPHF